MSKLLTCLNCSADEIKLTNKRKLDGRWFFDYTCTKCGSLMRRTKHGTRLVKRGPSS